MIYDDLQQAEWDNLISSRFGRYIENFQTDSPEGEAARNAFVDRVRYAFDCGNDLPRLFEDQNDSRGRADIMFNDVLHGLSAEERRYLKAHPADLGVRCEAYLTGIPVEAMLRSPRFGERDRQRLAELVDEALLEALPSLT